MAEAEFSQSEYYHFFIKEHRGSDSSKTLIASGERLHDMEELAALVKDLYIKRPVPGVTKMIYSIESQNVLRWIG